MNKNETSKFVFFDRGYDILKTASTCLRIGSLQARVMTPKYDQMTEIRHARFVVDHMKKIDLG